VAGFSLGVGVIGHASYVGEQPETGYGPGLEAALGSGRIQLFGEASLSYVSLQTWTSSSYDTHIVGWMGRGGLGVRWLARQLELERGFGAEMYLLAAGGYERIAWRGGGTLDRPDLDVGFAVQVRSWQHPRMATRIEARVVFTPNDSSSAMIACRGTCPASSGPASGLMTGLVFAW